MKPLATFVMRGYSQATLVACASALLSLLIPFIGLISSGVVALFTLRRGPREGLLLVALSTLAAGAISLLALGSPWVALGVLVVLWVPIWGLAAILRATRALGFTAQLAALGGLVMVLTIHLLVGEPSVYWQQLLEPVRQTLITDGLIEADASKVLFGELSKWMTGAFAAALVFQYLISLFIARQWQAQLYNPGGFGEEFRTLTVGRSFGLLFLAVLIWLALAKGAGLALDLLPVLALLLMFQGLAVAHRVRALLGAHQAWLIGVYLLLVLFMPQMVLLLASVGLADLWVDIRARVAQRVSGSR